MFQTHFSADIVAACAGLPFGLSEAIRQLQEVRRPVLLVCGEKFSDKIGTVRTSRMIFGDGRRRDGRRPRARGRGARRRYYQTYASGPMSEVDSIHLAQSRIRQQHHRVRARGEGAGQAATSPR